MIQKIQAHNSDSNEIKKKNYLMQINEESLKKFEITQTDT